MRTVEERAKAATEKLKAAAVLYDPELLRASAIIAAEFDDMGRNAEDDFDYLNCRIAKAERERDALKVEVETLKSELAAAMLRMYPQAPEWKNCPLARDHDTFVREIVVWALR